MNLYQINFKLSLTSSEIFKEFLLRLTNIFIKIVLNI